MSMISNLPLQAGVWHDFYAVTGFAPGTVVIGCNGGARISMFKGDQPDAGVASQGWEFPTGSGFRVEGESVWVRGNGTVILCGLQDGDSITPMAWHGSGGDSGGGASFDGAVTVADGANVALGSINDFPSAGPGEIASLISDVRGIWADMRNARRTATGDLLPANFEHYAQAMTYNDDGGVATITKTAGADTWVQTYTYEAGNLTAVSSWLRPV